MTDSKIRLILAVFMVLLLIVFALTIRMGHRIKLLDARVAELDSRLAAGRPTPPADPRTSVKGQADDQQVLFLAINKSLHREDREKYGEAVGHLYQQARARDRSEANPTERVKSEQAFSKLIDEYPEANATGMVIGERALESAMRMKTADVEFYFDMLSKQPKFQRIVTDMGIEAYPAILIYLTHQYIREGRMEKAEEFVKQLEKNYGNKFVADKGRAGEPEWKLGSEISEVLRREMAGPLGGPGMGPPPR